MTRFPLGRTSITVAVMYAVIVSVELVAPSPLNDLENAPVYGPKENAPLGLETPPPPVPVPTPANVRLPWKFCALSVAVVPCLDAVEDSLTVIVTMSPIFEALTSAKSDPLPGAHKEPIGARDWGGGPASGRGSPLEFDVCFGGVNEAAGSFFKCIELQPEMIRTRMTTAEVE
jgi:hypothetical protein